MGMGLYETPCDYEAHRHMQTNHSLTVFLLWPFFMRPVLKSLAWCQSWPCAAS